MKKNLWIRSRSLLTGLLMAFAMLCPRTMMADEVKWFLVAHDQDGLIAAYEMEQVGSLVAVDDAYEFTVLDQYGSTLAEKVLKVTFSLGDPTDPTAISHVRTADNTIGGTVKDKLTLIGASGTVTVYDIGGTKVAQTEAQGNETIVNVSDLPTGVYVVKSGKQIFKFIKK